MRRTITVALVVGTLLTIINQGDRIASGDIDAALMLKIAANYLIPWCVSSIGYISARRTGMPG
ncbi:MAG: nitrate/nitrite transporter NrtS [Thermoleophilia bacterium]